MADVNTAPRLSKNRRLGKNKKKSWRASNVEDVEEFLEDERRQIRTGGLVAEKADDTLFIVDTTQASKDAQRPRRRRLQNKQLTYYSLLQPDPHSKAVRIPDQDTFQKGLRKRRVLERLSTRLQSEVRAAAQKQSKAYGQARKVVLAQKKELPVVDTDLWTATDADNQATTVCKPPRRYYKKPSALQATVIPHPGASMNPAYEDHQDLLFQAHIKEEERMKKERKIYNALEAKFPSRTDAPNESTYLEEMSVGLLDDSDEEEDGGQEEDDTPLSLNPPVRREDRKTRKQRRVQKEQEIAASKRAKETSIKKRENMVLRIPTIKSDLNQAERKKKEKMVLRQKQKSLEPFQTKRLGKTKFEEPDQDLKLSTELVASLRELKPEGHLLNDIYKSLQRRNIVEPRVRQRMKRKYKPKRFEKKGHKAIIL